MSPILLLDLDDTLLANHMDTFLPAYLKALSQELKDLAPAERLVPTLLAATDKMVKNNRPDCTLKEVFDDDFYPALGFEPPAIQDRIERFYAQVFPQLRQTTQPRPGAVPFVEQALERGYRLVIATNPLFPRTAILQRLEWAGLPVERYSFDLITSYETFHFTKPHPAYFAEILGRLGWPEEPVLAVGNEPENDILPARELGLATFMVTNGEQTALTPPGATGALEDILPWIDRNGWESLQPDFTSPQAMKAILRATVAVLDAMCKALTPEEWKRQTRQNEWCPVEIVCHLRDVDAEVNLPRLQKVIHENNPFLPGKDTDPWAEERNYIAQNGWQALHRFIASRMELLQMLERLPEEGWQRPARHAIFGRTTLAEVVSIIAGHDRLHIRQLKESLKESL